MPTAQPNFHGWSRSGRVPTLVASIGLHLVTLSGRRSAPQEGIKVAQHGTSNHKKAKTAQVPHEASSNAEMRCNGHFKSLYAITFLCALQTESA